MSKLRNKISLLFFVAWTILVSGVTTVSGQHDHHGAHGHQQPTAQKTKNNQGAKKKASVQSNKIKSNKAKPKTTTQRGKTAAPKKPTTTKPQPSHQHNHDSHGTNVKEAENSNAGQMQTVLPTQPERGKPSEAEPGSQDAHLNHNNASQHPAPEHDHNQTESNNEQNGSRGHLPSASGNHDHNPQISEENQNTESSTIGLPEIITRGPAISLKQLEEMALQNNPTLKQAEFSIRAAEGQRRQAGLFPNPVIGYMAEDLSFRNFSEGGKHSFFVEQRIPLGGKLSKSRRVFAEEVKRKETDAEAQRLRVLNSVRLLYFEALGAQRLVEIKMNLAKLAEESVEISAELYNVGIDDKPDQLRTEIEQQRADAEYLEALNDYEETWQKIGAMTGNPEIEPRRLLGNLAEVLSEIDSDELLKNLLRTSPEIKAAEANVERAKAMVKRARAEKNPDLYLRGGIGYNNERLDEHDNRRRVGAEGFIEVGVTLPIFNRNQGGIQTAEAELGIAEREVDRLKLQLRTRFAAQFRNYQNSLFLAEKYREQIIPKAKTAFEMYRVNFQNMSAGYTKVLETRRAYLQAQLGYAQSLTSLQKTLIQLKGFLLTGGLNAAGETEGEAAENDEFRVSAENTVNEDSE